MNKLDIHQSASAAVERKPAPSAPASRIALASGEFHVDHYRNGRRINSYRFKNGITNEGKDALLDVMFHGGTQVTSWYLGLIDNAGYSALAATDTYANIDKVGNGWGEFTDYTDPGNGGDSTTRPEWTADAASGQAITNSSVVSFDITDTGIVKGIFLVGGGTDADTKGDNAGGGVLWATALFSGGDVPVIMGDTLRVTYTVSA